MYDYNRPATAPTTDKIPPKNNIGIITASPARTGRMLIIPFTIHIMNEKTGMIMPAPKIIVIGKKKRKTLPKTPINLKVSPFVVSLYNPIMNNTDKKQPVKQAKTKTI